MKRDLDALEGRPFDLLVVGAGIAGAAAAWDAAQRGLAVALVDAGDFGAATSWNSLKTVHGGLRHLQRLDVGGMRESVRERRALLRIAPTLVAPMTFVVPCRGHGPRGREVFAVARHLYNLLSRDRNDGLPEDRRLEGARLLSARELAARLPDVDTAGVTGALTWQDAQVERPERLLLAFVRAAADHGAVCANYVEATALVREDGGVRGARARDVASDRTLRVQARFVLLAVGAALDPLLLRSGLPPTGQPWLAAVNVVLRRAAPPFALGGDAGGRNLFLVPWRDRAMLGTDYAPPSASGEERVAALLRDGALVFPAFPCRREDVTLVHRGFVPGDARALRSRDVLAGHGPGVVSITAAKYTTARALAEKAIDRILTRLGRPPVPCRTAETPLPVPPDRPLDEEVRRAVRDEMALHLTDVVLRRTDAGTAGPPDAETLERALRVAAEERGWGDGAREAERAALHRYYAEAAGAQVQ